VSEVGVHIETHRDALERILRMHELHKLTIVVSRPNPPDDIDVDDEVSERLRDMRARKMSLTLDHAQGEGLDVARDKETLNLVRVARSNGTIHAVGRDRDGLVEKISTEKHPLIVKEPVEASDLLPEHEFIGVAKKVLGMLRGQP